MAVLATKLHAPVVRGRLVARPRLLKALDSLLEPGQRLGLVSAPAGFGKTTLLSSWAKGAASGRHAGGASLAWVSLDEGDNELDRLMTHLLASLSQAGAPVDDVLGAESSATLDVPAATEIVTAVVNRLAGRTPKAVGRGGRGGLSSSDRPTGGEGHWLLVLDDYHVITAPEVHETVTYLLDHLPEQLRVLVATRSDPPLPVPRLRSRGQLTELRAADLRFTHAEADDFFGDVMDLDLEASHVRALDDRTEGWAAGLQMAGLSLRGRSSAEDVAAFVAAFTGSNRFIVDYLADEVLSRQPEEVRTFLLRTSVLDRFTGSLCDAVTGCPGGAQLLSRLDRDNLFVVPLDDERTWYRYHHLFSDVLRARLQSHEPELVPHLHRAASDWFRDHDALEDAVQHAFAAEDYTRAGRLVERGLSRMRRARRDSMLLAWIRALPGDVVRPNPVLSTAAGWAAMVAGDLEGLERHLDDADAALAAAAEDPSVGAEWVETEDLRAAAAGVHMYRAALAQARGDDEGTGAHARAALELSGPQDHFIRGGGAGFLGLAAWARGDIHEALPTFEQAASALRAAGNHVDALDMTIVLADMWVTAGWPTRARDLCERALSSATEAGEPYPRATADLHTSLAELALGRNLLDEAEDELNQAAALAERGSITENQHRWPTVMAGLAAASGDYAGALGLLDRAVELYRPGFYPNLRPLAAARARLAVAAGDLAAAARWAAETEMHLDRDPTFAREYEHLTLVRVELARRREEAGAPRARAGAAGTFADLAGVLRLLSRLEDAAGHTGRHGSALEIRMLRALTQSACGDDDAAVATIAAALAAAPETDGYLRLLLDEGPAMTALLQQVTRLPASSGLHPSSALAQHLLRAAGRGDVAGRAVATRGDDGSAGSPRLSPHSLSEREQEVLRLLQSDLTGPEIARHLYISLNTLRTHTKRIFSKLGVTSRAAAVRRAREHQLL